MNIVRASIDDLVRYVAIAREAQAWLQSRGLRQYIPPAHDEYAADTRTKVESGTLFVVRDNDEAVGFFNLDATRSPWWPEDDELALYLAGMVVARSARGRGVGTFIIDWSCVEALRRECQSLRLDCHADNTWLCTYYERHGFELQNRIQHRPDYAGSLYQSRFATTPPQT